LSLRRIGAVHRIPFKLMLAVVFVSLLLREFYPFSWFPMYSNFSGRTWYVYVTDERDQPLALRELFGVTTPFLKKAYYSNLRAARKSSSEHTLRSNSEHPSPYSSKPVLPPEREAAIATLRFVTTEVKPRRAGAACVDLRLWKVDLARHDREITRERSLLGELPCP
jgi:hypothetical protein